MPRILLVLLLFPMTLSSARQITVRPVREETANFGWRLK